jgi:hypothetical protein
VFRLVYTDAYRRSPDSEPVNERRPHIVGETPEEEAFIVAQRTRRDLNRVFGPTYVGGLGTTLVNGVWKPSLRLKEVHAEIDADLMLINDLFTGIEKPYMAYLYIRSIGECVATNVVHGYWLLNRFGGDKLKDWLDKVEARKPDDHVVDFFETDAYVIVALNRPL